MHGGSAESRRLEEARDPRIVWKRWGPYLSERQWGTVREDSGTTGDAWSGCTHDQARSVAYRFGEDGLAGFSDDRQRLCFALALWNGRDPILKERLFGLTNTEGNHGEDVKEYYFYLDATPTHSYLKYLYKYPQRAFPYDRLVAENARRSRAEYEYELLDTGVFDDDRYFDVQVEYAKESPEEILILLTAVNRGPEEATLHLLPTLWFRNTWTHAPGTLRPLLRRHDGPEAVRTPSAIQASHPELGERWLLCDGEPELLFTENETNRARLFGESAAAPAKDAFHRYLIQGEAGAVSAAPRGTKAAAHYRLSIPAGGSRQVRLRLSDRPPAPLPGDGLAAPSATTSEIRDRQFGPAFDLLLSRRAVESDEFHADLAPDHLDEDERRILRQAVAGLLWSKQYYGYDVTAWRQMQGAGARTPARNRSWNHFSAADVLAVPDKWEYPWFATWDLAFHALAFQPIDPQFAEEQLTAVTRPWYMHPNGQLPAYEWNFSDVNPPVHAWAAWSLYLEQARRTGLPDRRFLHSIFQKLLINFTWWVNRKDALENNVFEGGFLGLDNIGVFDRSAPLPGGGHLEQADGTAWMALYALNLLEMALELAREEPGYQEIAAKFYEHFVYIAAAMDRMGVNQDELWDEEDGFYYDLLRFPDGRAERLKVRSMVGLLPLAANALVSPAEYGRLAELQGRIAWLGRHHPELTRNLTNLDTPGPTGMRMLSVLNETKLRRILARMLDEREFLSPYGIRSLSRVHRDHPFTLAVDREVHRVAYEPAESTSGLYGGNSNWRGPIWFPVNLLLCQALARMHQYYGASFTVECPTGSGAMLTLEEVSAEISRRLIRTFRREGGRRAVFGDTRKFQHDPHWRDHLLFYEYFHGDNGAGIGASHQTGWTALVALLLLRTSERGIDFSVEPR